MKDKKQSGPQALSRINFNSSRLIRFLADLAIADGAESKQTFPQRLGQWVSFTDANTLYTALGSKAAQATVKPSKAQAGAKSAAYLVVNEELTRVRTALVDLIKRSCSPALGTARINFPTPTSDTPPEIAASYLPFHRFYLALQRDMDARVAPLRVMVRDTLMTASPALKQLAALDTALDGILGDRERRLFGAVPLLLEKRFEQLRKVHQQQLVGSGKTDDPATWMEPRAWLADFRDELVEILLAELDVRLQPTMGLIEAFSNEVN
ncbi:Protein of unknown function [Polaromonas sp. OV174]|uniref:DUF3348 domain-containing protein n=1 Tax=Polaromonas sp. OV174 TaxID=1855300 RepID=UPI0008E24655|nr:DUF3348 domain-containing protein [Polaromonas sp. OV174]SFC62826.1 Protein of unknown function [Polaromonas sp. OV174]